jgi:hypothetical protein
LIPHVSRRAAQALSVVVALMLAAPSVVVADDMAPDGDGPTVANFSGLNFGNVCVGQTYQRDVPIYIQRSWPTPTDQSRTFNGGSPGVTFSFASPATNHANLGAALTDTSVVLPADWRDQTVWTNLEIYSGDSATVRVTLNPTVSGSGTVNLTATGPGGNTGTSTVTRTIQDLKVDWTVTTVGCDSTAPTVTVTFPSPDGDNSWFKTSPVVGSVSASDPSNVTAISCSGATVGTVSGLGTGSASGSLTVSSQGTSNVSCTATDGLGNSGAAAGSSNTATIQLDSVAPTLSPTVSPNPVLLNGSATASPGAGDVTSGVATSSCGAVDTSTVGAKTVSCTATDNAGNVNTANASYSVVYGFTGFFSPVDNGGVLNKAKAGQAIPLKWRLTDANGDPVLSLASVTATVTSLTCSLSTTADAVEEYATGSSGLQNLGDGYYQFNWATPKTYANSCKTLSLNLGDGVPHTALFQFTK